MSGDTVSSLVWSYKCCHFVRKIHRETWNHTGNFTVQDEWEACLTFCAGDGDGDSDEESEIDEAEETALESYETPLDKDDGSVDEYQIFKQLLEGRNK